MYAETNATIPALESARAPFFDKDVPENITAYEKALSYVHPNVLSQYIPLPAVHPVAERNTQKRL